MDNRTDRQLDKGNDMSIETMKLALDALMMIKEIEE